jgi:drug/metabolite transporter (DMT)-like permease
VAARESSVVIATVLAALILHERVTRLRLAGSILVMGGVALLALS